jgi:SAM-dependent methyltransferase
MTVKKIVDRRQVARNQARAVRIGQEGADFLYRAAMEDLVLRLSAVTRPFENMLLIAPLALHDAAAGLPADMTAKVKTLGLPRNGEGPYEALYLKPESFDLAVSLLTLHETNDLPGQLAQIRRALKPDGLFMACLPGTHTLRELRDSLLAAEAELTGAAHARVLPFVDVREAGGLLQRAGFGLPVADTETLTVRYASMVHLMKDLRAMGATNTLLSRNRRISRNDVFAVAAAHYADHHGDADGRIRASFEMIWMSGWVPHESQQKPLKPGSATVRLADVLKTAKSRD